MAWTAPRTWVAGETLTAALLNTHVRDNLTALTTWDAWTPTLSGSWTLGNGTLTGSVIQADSLIIARLTFTFGSTTSPSGALVFTLPATAVAATGMPLGWAGLVDTSAGARYFRTVVQTATTGIQFADLSDTRVTNTVPFTWATGDTLQAQFVYEAA